MPRVKNGNSGRINSWWYGTFLFEWTTNITYSPLFVGGRSITFATQKSRPPLTLPIMLKKTCCKFARNWKSESRGRRMLGTYFNSWKLPVGWGLAHWMVLHARTQPAYTDTLYWVVSRGSWNLFIALACCMSYLWEHGSMDLFRQQHHLTTVGFWDVKYGFQ